MKGLLGIQIHSEGASMIEGVMEHHFLGRLDVDRVLRMEVLSLSHLLDVLEILAEKSFIFPNYKQLHLQMNVSQYYICRELIGEFVRLIRLRRLGHFFTNVQGLEAGRVVLVEFVGIGAFGNEYWSLLFQRIQSPGAFGPGTGADLLLAGRGREVFGVEVNFPLSRMDYSFLNVLNAFPELLVHSLAFVDVHESEVGLDIHFGDLPSLLLLHHSWIYEGKKLFDVHFLLLLRDHFPLVTKRRLLH